MKHCCPCEDCKKSRKKFDRRTGRSHKVKGKDDDSPCEHCDTKIPHGVGQICRALREKVLLASDTNEGSKLTKDLKKENLKLVRVATKRLVCGVLFYIFLFVCFHRTKSSGNVQDFLVRTSSLHSLTCCRYWGCQTSPSFAICVSSKR